MFHRSIGGGDLLLGGGEGGAFGGVFALATYRTFRGVLHREPFQRSHHRLLPANQAMLEKSCDELPLASCTVDGVLCRHAVRGDNLLAVLSWAVPQTNR